MDLRARLLEFTKNVWDHSIDPFQLSFEKRRSLNTEELRVLEAFLEGINRGDTDPELARTLREELLLHRGDAWEAVIQISGLTRNKIIQDLKASAGSARNSLRLSNHRAILIHEDTWKLAGPYIVSRLRTVLSPISRSNKAFDILEAINQATWSGYIRQERAKRSGHEAEHRAAIALSDCNIPFEPIEKADNPLTSDVQINDVSFDLVVPNKIRPRMCLKSTVHTSNIGQYGESKDNLEVREARDMIEKSAFSEKLILVALVDGVGFESNKAGLEGVLKTVDEFVQFKTLWKLIVIAAWCVRMEIEIGINDRTMREHADFLDRYKDGLRISEDRSEYSEPAWVQVGEVFIRGR